MTNHPLPRAGVALPEVLVAAVLLAIGVAGTLSALSTAARFRAMAFGREAIAATAQGRLSWLELEGCASPDTTIVSLAGVRPDERWEVRRDSSGVRLVGRARAAHAGQSYGIELDTRLGCE